jgi:hypothetical protein
MFPGVRLDRVRGGRQKYKRASDVNPSFTISQSFSPQAKVPCYDGELYHAFIKSAGATFLIGVV